MTLALCQRPVSKLHITNILMRLIEEPRPAPLPPPLALKLVNEPLANTLTTHQFLQTSQRGGRGMSPLEAGLDAADATFEQRCQAA